MAESPSKKNPLKQGADYVRTNRRLVLVITVFALAVISIVFIALSGGNPLYRLRQIFSGSYGSVEFEAHTANGYAGFDDGLAVGTISGLFTYDLNNHETALAQCSMSVPQLRTGGDTVLACDIGGSNICAIQAGKGEVLNQRLDGTLLDGNVSQDGAICYAISSPATKTLLCVLDAEQRNVYNWYSETVYFNQCAVSDAATHLVGIRLAQESGAFESSAVIFSTTQEEPRATVSLGSEYFVDLDFVTGSTLCAVGEGSAHFFDLSGEQIGVYDYSDTYLTHYDTQGDGFIALMTNKNRAGGQFTLTTLDTTGKELTSTQISGPILDISAAGNYLAVLTADQLVIYNARLKVCAQRAHTDATQVVARSDGSALLIADGTATLFAG